MITLDFSYNPQTGRIVLPAGGVGTNGGDYRVTDGGGYDVTKDPYFTNFMAGTLIDGDQLVASLPATFEFRGGIGGMVTDVANFLGVPEWLVVSVVAIATAYALHEVV